ncbi:MmpS family transport accessory protein [Streptomyces sp. TRM76323]|uniref:MmpS family transport accessory protein n=1 Tax=Streptomyces tamarix TaxID=3078565 RepID=A0ABU3QKJ1_9ACTN|nr:MmpS family transport accessory protein [Streptomyces tamarix]MDT9683279.1 MmpS family transport accessory protein [Streptomyces tamarix]
MNRTSRSAVAVLAAAGLALGLGACSQAADEATERVDSAINETYQVTYEVTGAGIDSISYNGGGGDAMNPKLETVEKPTLPWRKTVTLRGIEAPLVTPVSIQDGARASCKITHKGKVLKEASGKGAAATLSCVAVSPIATE